MADVDLTELADEVADTLAGDVYRFTEFHYQPSGSTGMTLQTIDERHIDHCQYELILTDGERVWRVEVFTQGATEELIGEDAEHFLAQGPRRRPMPTGLCWCGCGAETPGRSLFLPGHDKVAESRVIAAEYGSVAGFIRAHGYGPGGKSARDAQKRKER